MTDESKAVRTLADILADREGRTFVSRLERKDVGLCIEILDRVSHNLRPLPAFALSGGFIRAPRNTTSNPQRSRCSSSL